MMMAFSWNEFLKKALQHKINRNISLTRGQKNKDFDKDHPDWIRDATSKNYTQMKKKIKEDFEKHQLNRLERLDKLWKK